MWIKLIGIVCCYVDDLYVGELEFQDLLCNLKQRFLVNKWKRMMFSIQNYIYIKECENEVMVDQLKFMVELDYLYIYLKIKDIKIFKICY